MSIVSKPGRGSMRPLGTRVISGASGLAVLLLLLWSFFGSRFVANTAGVRIALATAMVAGVVVGVLAWRKPPVLESMPAPSPAPGEERVIKAVGVGLLAGCMAFLVMSQGLLEAWTLAVGRPGQVTMHLGAYSHSRQRCDGFALSDAPLTYRRIICMPSDEAGAWPPGTPVVLTGVVSPVGIAVERYLIGQGK